MTESRTVIWPLGLLVCLLALTLIAPLAWRSRERTAAARTPDAAATEPQLAPDDEFAPYADPTALGVDRPSPAESTLRLERVDRVARAPAERLAYSGRSLASELPLTPPRVEPSSLSAGEPRLAPAMSSAGAVAPLPTAPIAWSRPLALEMQLANLPLEPQLLAWRREVEQAVADLTACERFDSPAAEPVLARLAALAATAPNWSPDWPEADRLEWQATRYALQRRTAVWLAAYAAAQAQGEPAALDTAAMLRRLDAAAARLGRSEVGAAWRVFFELDAIWRLARSTDTVLDPHRRAAAQRILRRIEQSQFEPGHEKMLNDPAIVALLDELRQWSAERHDYARLVEQIERFEVGQARDVGRAMAGQLELLAWSPRETDRRLAAQLEAQYRNANLRLAVHEELLNRLIAEERMQLQPVRDNILGAAVQGRSVVTTGLKLRLLPDPRRWRLGLEAEGAIASATTASKDGATFFNQGRARYQARKELELDGRKLFVWRSDVSTVGRQDLVDLTTDYDWLPVVNLLARSYALQQHGEQAPRARVIADARMQARLREGIDEEIHTRLHAAERELKTRVVAPLQRLQLDPTVTDLQTTETRLISRYRLAGGDQLGAHSVRPWAPTDSLVSLQLQQSAVNNLLEHLALDGRRVELHQLYAELIEKFGLAGATIPDDLPAGIEVEFAADESVRVDFVDGRVVLELRLAELDTGRLQWRDFMIRAYYTPVAGDPAARLAREPTIELIGRRLGMRDQIALRGIFVKALARERTVQLLPERLLAHPQLGETHLSQFVIADGWIGVALSPGAPNHAAWDEVADQPTESRRR